MSSPILGTLRRVDARDVWRHEAHEFTPWLKDHIGLLSAAIGIEIELVEREVSVGRYWADLFGREVGTGREVLIENQLEPTNHGHLGQILTYAAGLDAKLVIWIAPQFNDEHRQALEWLNRQTPDSVDFFGIELELLQIDDSIPAPNFKIVAQPSEFQHRLARRPRTARDELYDSFYEDLISRLDSANPEDEVVRYTSGERGWRRVESIYPYVPYMIEFFRGTAFRLGLFIASGDKDTNKAIFDNLAARRAELEVALDGPLIWERMDDSRLSRIYVQRAARIESANDELEALKLWALALLPAMWREFDPVLESLLPENYE